MSEAPDSFWDTDLLEQEISGEDEALQVLLLSLQAHADEICDDPAQVAFLSTRVPGQACVAFAGSRQIGIVLSAETQEETDAMYGLRQIDSPQAAPVLNSLPSVYRTALACMLCRNEASYVRENLINAGCDPADIATIVSAMMATHQASTEALTVGDL